MSGVQKEAHRHFYHTVFLPYREFKSDWLKYNEPAKHAIKEEKQGTD
ncbi:hypothetical protein [Paenibacillus dendrobii]|nr:hypothetical protein [Paenibacillus dendrobii]